MTNNHCTHKQLDCMIQFSTYHSPNISYHREDETTILSSSITKLPFSLVMFFNILEKENIALCQWTPRLFCYKQYLKIGKFPLFIIFLIWEFIKYGWVSSSFPVKLQSCTTSFTPTQAKWCQWETDQVQAWVFINSNLGLKLLFNL